MIETKEKTIGDCVYSVTQMTALSAVRMQARLLRLIGPTFGAMMSADKKNPDSCLPLAITLLADKLDEKTFEDLVLDLLKGVRKDNVELKKDNINLDFSGKLNDLFRVLQFVLETNFSDFFQEGGIIKELIKLAEKSKEETTSTISPS